MHIELHAKDIERTAALEEHVHRRLDYALGRFGDRVHDVRVRLTDENGPRGGDDDIRCHVRATVGKAGTLLIEQRGRDAFTAVARAARRLGQEAGRKVNRLGKRRRGR